MLKLLKPKCFPPWTGLGKTIESKIRKALFDFSLVEKVPKVAVALSGGKDSVTLCLMLAAISGRGFPPFELVAIHVSGEFSCGGGILVDDLEMLCKELNIPLIVRTSNKKLEELECYSCSRERRRLLFEAAKEAGATTIAFGHHRDDNAQTVMMNLLHKGEFCGLLPKLEMKDFNVTIIRPLTYVSEQETKKFAEKQGFLRTMCRCPVGQNSMRRKTDDLIGDLEGTFENARANLAHAALTYGSEKARRNK